MILHFEGASTHAPDTLTLRPREARRGYDIDMHMAYAVRDGCKLSYNGAQVTEICHMQCGVQIHEISAIFLCPSASK